MSEPGTGTAPDATARLVALGLSEPAARAYAFLVTHSPATAREVARATGLHRTRAYAVLEEVEKLGLAESLVGEPRRYVALPLAGLLDREITRAEAEARSLNGAMRVVRHLFPDDDLHPAGAFGDLKLTTGRRKAASAIARAMLDARTRVWWLTTPAGLARFANHMDGADALDALAAHACTGVDARVILVTEGDGADAAARMIARDALDSLPSAIVRDAPDDLAHVGHRLVVDGARALTTFPDADDTRAYRGDDACLDTTIPALVKDAESFLARVWAESRERGRSTPDARSIG